jgi:hypothetical protein
MVWALAAGATLTAAAETHVYDIPFEKPMSWSGVMLPWGGGGFLDWVIADGGKEGKALRVTSALGKRAVTYEIRTLMFNHEPDTPARIELDVRPVTHPKGSLCMVRWFDGYVCAEAFERSADDKLAPFPPPIYERSSAMEKPGWERLDFRTPPLKHTVLTIAFMVRQPPDPDKAEQDEFIDYLFDNLRVEVTPLSHYMDPGFDWHGQGGGTETNWRWTTAGAHVDWCDFMDEVITPWDAELSITYGLDTFRDTGAGLLTVKHDFVHDTSNVSVGGASTISLARYHPGDVPASWGVRQTVSYAALGLSADDVAHLRVSLKYTFDDPAQMGRAYLELGCDPRGGVLTENALWGDHLYNGWLGGQWSVATLEFDRPPGATAFTVFFRCRDGVARKGGPVATVYGSRAIADWLVVEVVK